VRLRVLVLGLTHGTTAPAFKHVVFDLDGTLVDSLDDLTAAVNHVLASFGQPVLSAGMLAGFVGDGARKLVERALAHAAPDRVDAGLARFVAYYDVHLLDRTRAYPGVGEMLVTLRAAGLACSVLTNKPVAMSRAILEGLGLLGSFAEVLGGDSRPARKPDPDGLLHLARLADALPSQILLVGDSAVDVRTARAAGAGFCGVSWGLAPDRLRAERPDRIVDHPRDVVAVALGE
jgi:phosphoglycolate phosphatase